jgi:hypothetical protein
MYYDDTVYEKVRIDGETIHLCAERNAEIKVHVNDEIPIHLPLVYKGKLTIRLTVAGLEALGAENYLCYGDVEKVEFDDPDAWD